MRHATITALLLLGLCNARCSDDSDGPAGPGSGYDLALTSPFPETLSLNDRLRTVVLRYEDRVNLDGRGTRCTATSLTLDVTSATAASPAAIDNANRCRLYTAAPELAWARQRPLCVGAYAIASGNLQEAITFCPQPGASAVRFEQTLSGCGGFASQRLAQISSVDEGVEGDAVTDLMGNVEFPSAVTITGPSALPIVTWPAEGDLTLTWEASGATSALVRVEAATVTDPSASPVIVCNPSRQGRVTVSQSLIAQANFRSLEARVRITSFRDREVTAAGSTWRLSGATSSNLTLQARR